MWIYIAMAVVIVFILFVVYKEYQNEKRYRLEQEAKRRKRRQKLTPKVEKRRTPAPRPEKTPPHEGQMPEATKVAKQNVATPKRPTVSTPEKEEKEVQKAETKAKTAHPAAETNEKTPPAVSRTKTEPSVDKTTPTEEEKKEQTPLPSGDYPEFSYKRLLEMGLNDEEAKEFVRELIPQIDEQIPKIEEAMEIPDYHKMERLTHSIKGSSTNLGEGGVADVLVDYNTYLKSGKDMSIIRAYHKHLITYLEKLKKRFSKTEA